MEALRHQTQDSQVDVSQQDLDYKSTNGARAQSQRNRQQNSSLFQKQQSDEATRWDTPKGPQQLYSSSSS
jgi:hypothetical protein